LDFIWPSKQHRQSTNVVNIAAEISIKMNFQRFDFSFRLVAAPFSWL